MTPTLMRGLWLWAGALLLVLLIVFPLTWSLRAMAVLVVVCVVGVAWNRIGRRATSMRASLTLAENTSLPPAAYRQPVVLVCGDGLTGLFGATPVEQLALRTTRHGCYLRVPGLEQLPAVTASLMTLRPEWSGQLSVMFIVNPAEHADTAVLAGQARALRYQVGLIRKGGVALPLLLTSYVQVSAAEGPWFSWEAGEVSPRVREAGTCASLDDWQRQPSDSATRAARMHTSVKLNSVVAWLDNAVLPHLAPRDVRDPDSLPRVCAITFVPALAQSVAGNLWQQWLRNKVALHDVRQAQPGQGTSMPFPDPLLALLPTQTQRVPLRRASVIALWMFAIAGTTALASSAWQNTLLVRQVSDDLRRYHAIPASGQPDRPEFILREQALAVLREDALRLDSYYRHGAPLSLGLGLYRGERLRIRLQSTIAAHRHPSLAPRLVGNPKPVRLDSLSLFSTGSAQLKPGSTRVLINALVDIKAQPGWLIVISGHTDATGSAEQNLQLSRARAAAVHDWMQHMGGIPASCFAVQGFGASQPIASNDNETGRSANRRVDIRLVPEPGACVFPAAGPDLQPPVA
ncbi:OmpA family protein [Pseudomonas putida]|jgi:outer membrane protein OmpA-like peptidoglycan-associated protein|uniref:OmpA family protein n=1 Tax=Pseudomonas putida TaxID=303 RepID=UPI0009825ECE|nr:OmpA family protein [Pseudomonas putida]OMQ40619.1 flagellar motor protein MotB [Pseudomonas putida]